jgi:3-hydroxyisobutyrate dehydrogenase
MTVGFIGIGRMGMGMASNLARHTKQAGIPMIVYDKNPEPTAVMKERGATVADSIAEIARAADVLFMSLPGPPEVEAVTLANDGVLHSIKPGSVVFDLSTNSVALTRRLHEAFGTHGAQFLDAPVSGGPEGAASGDLVVWVGGDKAAYDRHLPLISTFSKMPCYVGSSGAGAVTKLAHNALSFMVLTGITEVFSLAAKGGVEPLALWEALRLGVVGKQSILDMLPGRFLPGKFKEARFALKLAHKDITLASALGKDLGVPLRMINMMLEEMTEGMARGWADWDCFAYLQLQLDRAGITMDADPAKIQALIDARTKAAAVKT